jgi:hypothetical protein
VSRRVAAHRSLLGNLWDLPVRTLGINIVQPSLAHVQPPMTPPADSPAPEEGGQAAYDVSAPPATRLPNARWDLGSKIRY